MFNNGLLWQVYITWRILERVQSNPFKRPDATKVVEIDQCVLGFHRLSIMGIDQRGMQPFKYKNNYLVCNGEIYGFRKIKEELIKKGINFNSESDCEILLPFYEQKV